MKIAAIYARQSVTAAGDKDVSIDDQLERCRALPAVQACEQIEVYIDRNRSGQDATREQYNRLLGDIEAGKISVVAAYDDSRIRRENEIGARFMNLFIARGDIQCVFADGGRFETTPDGELEWILKGAFARKQARDSGIRLSNAHQRQRDQGYATGSAPYGYRYDRKLPGEKWPLLVSDEETAPVLQRIFRTFAEGTASMRQIAEALAHEKVPAPVSNRNRNRPDRAWTADVIGGMLANRRYIGEPPAKWKALVERDLFERVQQRLASKAQGKARGKRSSIFGGLLYCQECGRRMSPTYIGRNVYYQCGSKNSLTPCGLARDVKETDLLRQVEAVFADFLNGIPAATPTAIVETNEIKVAKLRKQLERVGERYETEGTMSAETYRAKVAEIKAQIAVLEQQPVKPVDPRELLTLGQQWRSGDASVRSLVVRALWERVEVRLDDPTDDEVLGGEVTRSDRKVARVVKLLARADRASQAHALVTAAMEYVKRGVPVPFDEEGIPIPHRDGGPGASLANAGSIPIHPRQSQQS